MSTSLLPRPQLTPSPLGEAISGTLASLISVVLFYPVDIWKTSLQASTTTIKSNEIPSSSSPTKNNSHKAITLLTRIIQSYKSGLHYKIIHTVTSAFLFYYLSSYLKRLYTSRYSKGTFITPSASLCLSSIAAMANTVFTLPLDAIVTRKQLQCLEEADETENDSTTLEKGFAFNTASFNEILKEVQKLFKGLKPSLMLSMNPGIHHTSYDIIKQYILTFYRPSTLTSPSSSLGRDVISGRRVKRRLTISEAFLAGVLAKCIATVVTYPLIRVKVLMMTDVQPKQEDEEDEEQTITSTLKNILKTTGLKGVYSGMGVQLAHTVLKAVLVIVVKEEIDVVVWKLMR